MIIKNKVDKVIDILTYDLEDRTAIEQYLSQIEVLRSHESILINNLKLVYFDLMGQFVSCEENVYIYLKGSITSESLLVLDNFQILKPTIMLSFSRQLFDQILESRRQLDMESKLYFLIKYPFFNGIYMSDLRAILDKIPQKQYHYKTNLTRILPGIICIIKSGSVVLQSFCSKSSLFPKQFSIISDFDIFGETFYIDGEGRINLKQLQIKSEYYEAICSSSVVELYLLKLHEIMHSINLQQLKIYLQNKFKQRFSQMAQALKVNESYVEKQSQSQSPIKQKPKIRMKTTLQDYDKQIDSLKEKEFKAINKVKEVVKNMNMSYSRTKNYFMQKTGTTNVLFFKVFTSKEATPTFKPKRKFSLRQIQNSNIITQRTERCKTMANEYKKSSPQVTFCKSIRLKTRGRRSESMFN